MERHHLTFDTYETGKLDLDTYLARVVFYEPRSFSQEEFEEFMFAQSQPYQDTLEFFRGLGACNGYRLAAISNEGRELADYRIDKFRLHEFLQVFVISSFVHVRKPDVDIFHMALDLAHAQPESSVYVEDRLMFATVAHDLGFNAIHHTDLSSTPRLSTSWGWRRRRGGGKRPETGCQERPVRWSNHEVMTSNRETLPETFLQGLTALERSYLQAEDPCQQSGFGGGPERWRTERGIILEAVEGDGDFLDIGCANGHLLACLVTWGKERGLTLTPYGLDQGANLIELAQRLHPEFAANLWVANAWEWTPPRKFRYVYSCPEYVPEPLIPAYPRHLGEYYVESGGRLILGSYGSGSLNQPARDVAALLGEARFSVVGTAEVGWLPFTRLAWADLGE